MSQTFDRDRIIAENPLMEECERRGMIFARRAGREFLSICPFHEDSSPSFRVDPQKQLWTCDPCGIGGSVIDLVMRMDGIGKGDAMRKLSGATAMPMFATNSPVPKPKPKPTGEPVKTYDYADANGRLVFQVCRYEPKDFRQRRPDKKGGWEYNLNGVSRVLYNLPKVSQADFVWLVEGEKDADTLNQFAPFTATTNAGGAEKWEAQYTEALAGKDVIICGDNDDKGRKHIENIKKQLENAARSIRIVRVPDGFKDVTEWFEHDGKRIAVELLTQAENAEVLHRGAPIPVLTMEEMETRYRAFTKESHLVSLDLGSWLPSLRYSVRPLVPGEVVLIIGDTGVGKTMLLQNIAIHSDLPTLLFEIELPDTLTFERFVGMATKRSGKSVFDAYKTDAATGWKQSGKLNNVSVCCVSRLTPADIERIIEGAGIKTGSRPVVVLIDYIQLIRGGAGKGRYETLSLVAEELKVVAKQTRTIIVIASQVARKDDAEVGLHDAKDSGSIENSSGLVLGAWRDSQDPNIMHLKVCKNTKGNAGFRVRALIHESLLVSEIHDPTAHPST